MFGIAVDAAGHVYASNHYRNSITEYAPGANGNVAPIATLTGPATGVQLPTGIALDPAGQLWVDNAAGHLGVPGRGQRERRADRRHQRPAGQLLLGDRL